MADADLLIANPTAQDWPEYESLLLSLLDIIDEAAPVIATMFANVGYDAAMMDSYLKRQGKNPFTIAIDDTPGIVNQENNQHRRRFQRAYNALDVSDFKHYRINHSKLFADKGNHINGIENFWNQTKRHMRKFNGVPRDNFGLFLKECEWRFNNPSPQQQLKQIKQWVKQFLF